MRSFFIESDYPFLSLGRAVEVFCHKRADARPLIPHLLIKSFAAGNLAFVTEGFKLAQWPNDCDHAAIGAAAAQLVGHEMNIFDRLIFHRVFEIPYEALALVQIELEHLAHFRRIVLGQSPQAPQIDSRARPGAGAVAAGGGGAGVGGGATFSEEGGAEALHRSSAAPNSSTSTGFVIQSSIPAARQRSRSPCIALAVMAIICSRDFALKLPGRSFSRRRITSALS